jgi:hypothetical protein
MSASTSVRRPSRARVRLAALAAAPVLAAAVAVPAGAGVAAAEVARPAGTVTQEDVTGAPLAVTTTKGVKLTMAVDVSDDPGTTNSVVAVDLFTAKDVEVHGWTFDDKAPDFTTKGSGGSFNSGASLGSFGHVDLTFTRTGSVARSCLADQPFSRQKATVKATISFNTMSTGSHAWGSIPARSYTFGAASDVGEFSSGTCTMPTEACTLGDDWILGHFDTKVGAASELFSGSQGGVALGPSGDVVLSRVTELAAPAGALRVDSVESKEPFPKLTVSGSSATMSVTTSSGVIHGSATLKSIDKPEKLTMKCSGTKSETETTWAASYTNGRTALAASEQIYGTITAKNQTGTSEENAAEIDRYTAG